MEVILQSLVHLGCHEEDVRRHLLHRMTHNGDVMVYSSLQPWSHPWKWLQLEWMNLVAPQLPPLA